MLDGLPLRVGADGHFRAPLSVWRWLLPWLLPLGALSAWVVCGICFLPGTRLLDGYWWMPEHSTTGFVLTCLPFMAYVALHMVLQTEAAQPGRFESCGGSIRHGTGRFGRPAGRVIVDRELGFGLLSEVLRAVQSVMMPLGWCRKQRRTSRRTRCSLGTSIDATTADATHKRMDGWMARGRWAQVCARFAAGRDRSPP